MGFQSEFAEHKPLTCHSLERTSKLWKLVADIKPDLFC